MINIRTYDEATPYLMAVAKAMPEAIKKGMMDAAFELEGEIREEIQRTFPTAKTGELMNSYHAQWVTDSGPQITTGVYSDLVYARIQNEGGTIYPRTVKNLAIPISPKAKMTIGKWPRHYPKDFLTLIQKKGKAPVLVHLSKNGKIEDVYFVLAKSSTIPKASPKRKHLERGADKALPGIERILGDKVELVIDKTKVQVVKK